MTVKQYKAFVTSVDEGTISNASKKLDLTQGNVTQLILSLEKELGFSLCTRNKSGIRLTEKGEKVLPLMREIIEREKRLLEVVNSINQKENKVVRIGTFSSVGVKWLPSIMKEFSKIDEEVQFVIKDGGYGEILESAQKGEIDLAFVSLPCYSSGKVIPLFEDRMLALVPSTSSLSSLSALPLKTFETESVISLASDTDHDARKIFSSYNIKPNVKYVTGDDYAMIAMVENSLGICLQPELLLNNLSSSVVALPTNPPCYRTIALLIPLGEYASATVNKVAKFIENWVKEKHS